MCFHKGRNKEWQDVEEFARSESCGKEENLPASPYKVIVSSNKLTTIPVANTLFLTLPLCLLLLSQENRLTLVLFRADHCAVCGSHRKALELNSFMYVLNVCHLY